MAGSEIDDSVLEACRRGERDAFRALYETYKDRVYSICLYFFHGDTAEAADVTQEVFLKLFGGIRSYQGDALFSTWLYRLVQNACLDAGRRKTARARLVETRDTAPASPEDELVNSQQAEAVQEAVSTLPPKFRLPILLRYFSDFSYEEMSATLNCSMGTVASRLNRGHKMLGKILGGRDV